MFERLDYPELQAIARARILYYMQTHYYDAQLNEPKEERSRLLEAYLLGFTGRQPAAAEVAELRAYAKTPEKAG